MRMVGAPSLIDNGTCIPEARKYRPAIFNVESVVSDFFLPCQWITTLRGRRSTTREFAKSFTGDGTNVQRNSDLKKKRYASSSRNYSGVAKTSTRFS
jgi:hypothetical protein